MTKDIQIPNEYVEMYLISLVIGEWQDIWVKYRSSWQGRKTWRLWTLEFIRTINNNFRKERTSLNYKSPTSQGRRDWLAFTVCTVLAEKQDSVPSSHIRWLSTNCTPSSRVSSFFFWPPWTPACTWHMHMCAHTHVHAHIYTK